MSNPLHDDGPVFALKRSDLSDLPVGSVILDGVQFPFAQTRLPWSLRVNGNWEAIDEATTVTFPVEVLHVPEGW